MTDDLIAPDEHYPVNWVLRAAGPLDGDVAFAFTRSGALPAHDAVWYSGIWVEPTPAATRTAQLVVAGSGAAGLGVHPGVGDFTVFVRCTDGASARIRRDGQLLRVR